MKINDIITACTELVKKFSQNEVCNGFDFKEDKSIAVWTVYSKLIKIEFLLTKKESIFVPASTLYSRIYLHTNSERFLHIPEIIDEFDAEDFHCYYFPYIESEEKLKSCFKPLEEFYIKHLPTLWEIAYDEERSERIYERKKAEYKRIVDIQEDDDEYLDMYNFRAEKHLILTRYTKLDAYTAFLYGNYDKALVLYGKLKVKNQLFDYEKRLLEFIPECEEVYEAVFPGCSDLKEINGYILGQEYKKAKIKFSVFLYVVFYVLFLIIGLGFEWYFSEGTLFFENAGRYFVPAILAFLPALIGGTVLSRPLIMLLSGKKKRELLAFDEAVNERGGHFVLAIILAASLLLSAWFGSMYLACYEDRFEYNDSEKFLSFETKAKYYKDITAVYHVDGQYNDYGDWIDRAFYVICFKDGTTFNTDGTIDEDEAREGFLPVIADYYNEVIYVTTEDEIIFE